MRIPRLQTIYLSILLLFAAAAGIGRVSLAQQASQVSFGPALQHGAGQVSNHASPAPQQGYPSTAPQRLPSPPVRVTAPPASLAPPPPQPVAASSGPVQQAAATFPLTQATPVDQGADVRELAKRLTEIETELKKAQEAADEKEEKEPPKHTVKIVARIHTDYWAFPEVDPDVALLENPDGEVNDRILFRRIRLGIAGDVLDNMLYVMNIDFNVPQNPQLKDVYLGWKELPVFQTVLVGHQKRPYGLDHMNSSNANIFLERPLIVEGFLQDTRRWGITSNGVSEDERYNWRYGFYMSEDMQSTGVDLTTENGSYQGEFAARLANTFWYDEGSDGRYYGHLAVAGRYGAADGFDPADNVARFQTRPEARTSARWYDTGSITAADSYSVLALENVWNWGPVNLTGEAMASFVDRPGFEDAQFYGAYAQAAWVLTGEHHPWDRATGTLKPLKPFENFWMVRTIDGSTAAGWGAWEIAARYSFVDFSDAGFYGGRGNQLTLGMQWFWNQHARLQANYIFGNLEERFAGNDPDEPRNGDFQIAGLRFIIYI